jgi:hypothetical protein
MDQLAVDVWLDLGGEEPLVADCTGPARIIGRPTSLATLIAR